MELMVYIAILGVIVLIAGNAFSDSTRFLIPTAALELLLIPQKIVYV